MSIVFYCQNCGSRFDVDDRAAGKSGRCKHCGQKMVVPQAGTMASLAATPHLAMAAAAAARGKPVEAAAGGGPDWLAQVNSQTALAPLTVDRMPAVKRSAPIDDDLGDSKPYALVEAPRKRRVAMATGGPAGEAKIVWRRWLGQIQKLFRWINETGYLVSVPFIMLIFLGAMMHNRPMAHFGAVVVVALNIGRLVSGLANIVVIPFRDSPLQGALFLIPPLTFFYMSNNWKKFKRPVERVTGPLLTIGLVALAFLFVPSLSGKSLKASVKDVGRTIESKAGRLKKADLKSLASPDVLQQVEGKVESAKVMIRDQADQIKRAAQTQ